MKSQTVKNKKRAEANGRMAEYIVALSYMLRGYRLMARRYRCRAGEIDLIMGRGRARIFIEVKYRHPSTRDNIEAAIPQPRQLRRIRLAAEHYLGRSGLGRSRDEITECHIHIVILHGWLGWRVFRNPF